jgi:hypothetical protein
MKYWAFVLSSIITHLATASSGQPTRLLPGGVADETGKTGIVQSQSSGIDAID